MSTIDQQFVEFVVKSLVGKPDAVVVTRTIDEKGVLLELTVDPEDLGRVIGKKGATAQSLRTLLRALGTKNDARYNLRIIDNGPERSYNHSNSNEQKPNNDQYETTLSEARDDSTPEEPAVSEQPVSETQPSKEEDNTKYDKTRKELEDLDDLDI